MLEHSGTYALPVVKMLPPEALVKYAPAIEKLLKDNEKDVREAAALVLRKLV